MCAQTACLQHRHGHTHTYTQAHILNYVINIRYKFKNINAFIVL